MLDLDSRQLITQLLILLRLIWVEDELVVFGNEALEHVPHSHAPVNLVALSL